MKNFSFLFSSKNRKLHVAFIGFVACVSSLIPTFITAILSNALVLWSDFYAYCIDAFVLGLSFLIILNNQKKQAYFEFGLGKIEAISSILISILISLYGIIILYSVYLRILTPMPISNTGYGTVLYIILTLVHGYLLFQLVRLAKKDSSPLVSSQKAYYVLCVITDLIVLLPLVLGLFLPISLIPMTVDILASLGICFLTLYLSFHSGKKAVFDLLDKSLEERTQLIILKQLSKHFELYEQYHGQRTRQSAEIKYIDLFLEFNQERSLAEVMSAIETLQTDIEQAVDDSYVCIIPSNKKYHHKTNRNKNE